MNEPLIQVKDLKTFFKVETGILKAVNGVSLEIQKGETLGLIGESGCGKSTLGKTMMRIYKPKEGVVSYKGKDIWSYDKREIHQFRKNVQMIFQDPYASLDPLYVVRDVLAEGIDAHKLYKGRQKQERIEELLDMVGLNKEHANHFPHELSGGQRQRVGIARALSVEPEFIICDEPISALDVSIQAQVINLMKKLQSELGLSYLFITHDLSMVRIISDRIAVMYLGEIVELAPRDELYQHYLHPYTEVLMAAIPVADPIAEKRKEKLLVSGDVPSPIDLPDGCYFSKRCPYATEQCRTCHPELTEVSSGHFVACHRAKGV